MDLLAEKRVHELQALINQYNYEYHVLDKPSVLMQNTTDFYEN